MVHNCFSRGLLPRVHVLSLRLPGRGVRVTRAKSITNKDRPRSLRRDKTFTEDATASPAKVREDAWHQEVGHGRYQALHLEGIQHVGGHKRGQDLITNLQRPRSIYVHQDSSLPKLHVKSESQRKPERHSRKEKPNQDWPVGNGSSDFNKPRQKKLWHSVRPPPTFP